MKWVWEIVVKTENGIFLSEGDTDLEKKIETLSKRENIRNSLIRKITRNEIENNLRKKEKNKRTFFFLLKRNVLSILFITIYVF